MIDDDEKMTSVALKKMKSSGDNMAVRDFKREIKIMKDLSHPNIVKVINYIDEPKRPLIIIMEYMDKGDLHTFVKTCGASLSIAKMLKYAKNIASVSIFYLFFYLSLISYFVNFRAWPI